MGTGKTKSGCGSTIVLCLAAFALVLGTGTYVALTADAPAVKAAPASKSARDDSAAEKLGWRLGLQAYTLRSMSFFEAVDKAAALGLKYIEMYPGQRMSKENPTVLMNDSMSAELQEQVRKKLQEAGVKVVCYGVTGIGGKEQDARKVFDFAKKMGIETIVTETPPSDLLDKLCEEYGINIALHNHPATWRPDAVLAACKGHTKRAGACADTGHWMRAGIEPGETLKKLEGRIISLHFKDLNEFGNPKARDVPWGTGKGDPKAWLTELHRQGFKGVFSIEYESGSGQELLDNIAKCVEFFDKTAAELGAEKKDK